jgi:hypothetical protein
MARHTDIEQPSIFQRFAEKTSMIDIAMGGTVAKAGRSAMVAEPLGIYEGVGQGETPAGKIAD